MTRHQRTTSILVFAALLLAVLPGAALGNSLLSGYGGPGEGNQAILGSALVNTPKGGGGSGGGGSGGSESSVGQTSSSRSGEAVPSQSGHATGTGKAKGGRSSKRVKAAKPGAGGGAARAPATGSVIYPAASREVTTGGSRALGLSGTDFVYIILALGVLALTGFLTVRLARTTVTRGPDARP